MIGLCVAQIGKNKYSITTTDMKDALERKYRQTCMNKNMEALQYYQCAKAAWVQADKMQQIAAKLFG